MLPKSLGDIAYNVNSWNGLNNLGLTELQTGTPTVMAWSIGNCIIYSRRITDNTADFLLVAIRKEQEHKPGYMISADKHAHSGWMRLGSLFESARWIERSAFPRIELIPLPNLELLEFMANSPNESTWKAKKGGDWGLVRRLCQDGLSLKAAQLEVERIKDNRWNNLKYEIEQYKASVNRYESLHPDVTPAEAVCDYVSLIAPLPAPLVKESAENGKKRVAQDTTWHGTGELPKTRAEKIAAARAWDSMPKNERPKLRNWLLENFGSDYATGEPNVADKTFHDWRNLEKPE